MLIQPERSVPPDRAWINTSDFLSTLREELASYAESHRLTLHVEYAHFKDIWLFVDPTLLKQVLLSMLDNAIKYAEETSTIYVVGELSPNLFHIRVRDRGIPLRGQYLDRIFQQGFRTPEAEAVAPGTGYGLWLAKAIMQLHGAEIVAEGTDRTTGYTSFDLRFPNKSDMVRKGV
jgi:two-component system OmpR family sensor kinase